MMDYAQDISVFLVSCYRLPVFSSAARARIGRVTTRFHEFAQQFAVDAQDTMFGARLGLGLARSFATSSRFILDEEFSKSMFLRSRYLLERLLEAETSGLENFRIPPEALID
jgi:hypothetical protein